jgi:hypothetical protein
LPVQRNYDTEHLGALGANPDGSLVSIIHEAISETSQFED